MSIAPEDMPQPDPQPDPPPYIPPDASQPPPTSPPPPSGSGSSGSSGSSSGGAVAGTGSNIGQMVAGIGTFGFAIQITDATKAVNLPGRTVAPDEVVEISPAPTNNAAGMSVANSPSDALNGPNKLMVLTPSSAGTPRSLNVGRLNELWVAGALNDVLFVIVRRSGRR